MNNDREIAKRNLDRQARARDYRILDIPSYMPWSERKLDEGESPAFIENLDAMTMWLLPEEVQDVKESEFEEMLADIKEACGEQG